MQPVSEAAATVLACLQAFGENASNPVLAVLGGDAGMVVERKYPDPPLVFGGGRWRAYYHCHQAPLAPREHGHFHVFTRADDGNARWAHVAGLSMDYDGQPLRWFSVNAWVSDDAWLPATRLVECLEQLTLPLDDELLPAWLSAMLCLYRDELAALQHDRDAAMDRLRGDRPLAEALADRDIYQLAERPIDVAARLTGVLAAPATAQQEGRT